MYIRIYNKQLVCVYEKNDLENSEIIGKIKGRDAVGLSVRENNKIIYHEIGKVTAKELQLIIRNRKTVTIAIEMTQEEIIDYFYTLIDTLCGEGSTICCNEINIDECITQNIDSGIAKSEVFDAIKPKIIERLQNREMFTLL